MDTMIKISGINKTFHLPNGSRTHALANINLEIGKGEFFILLGPSGCGKSTLLRIICGLEKASGGELIFGESVKSTEMSFVFQQFALLPWLSVYENVELSLLAKNLSETDRRTRINAELERLRLDKFAHAYPRELSGGMKQRVGIARAFATQPKIILMDEPFSELDSFIAQELREVLLDIWLKEKPTIVMVTHIIPEALELADRIAVMTSRPGTIEKLFTNDLARPRAKRSPEFFKFEDEVLAAVKP